MKGLMTLLVVVAVLFWASSISTADDSAMEQLIRATSGTQSTGETFDGGPGPTDAYPTGGETPEAPEPKPVESVGTSTGTASGYDVGTSSGTTSGYDVGTSSDTASEQSGVEETE